MFIEKILNKLTFFMRLDNHDYNLDAQQALNILLKRAAATLARAPCFSL